MGKKGTRNRGGSIEFPRGFSRVRRMLGGKTPKLTFPKEPKGDVEVRGTRITKHGLSPEEQLMRYAPEGTKPERMLFGWLKMRGLSFGFQQPLMGGRLPGGAVVDFIIYDNLPPLVIRVQSYWHESASAQWMDSVQRDALENLGYQVEDIWEKDLQTYEDINQIMNHILYGFPRLGGGPAPISVRDCPYCDEPDCVRYQPTAMW